MMLHGPVIIQGVRKISRPLSSWVFLHRTVAEHPFMWLPIPLALQGSPLAGTKNQPNFCCSNSHSMSLIPFISSAQCRFSQGCPSSLCDHFLGVTICILSRCSAVAVLVQQDKTILNNAPGVLPCLFSSQGTGTVVSWAEVLFLRDHISKLPDTHLYPQSPVPAPGLYWNNYLLPG